MSTQIHEGRAVLVTKIEQQLGTFVNSVEIAIKNNLPSRNVVAETTLAGLLNRIHGWNLVNANLKSQNYPGVDLIDTTARVAVQVTSSNTTEKVDKTLKQFSGRNMDNDFDRLFMVVITNELPKSTMKQRCLSTFFSGDRDIWNIPKILSQIKELDIGVLEDVHDYLNKELGVHQAFLTRRYLKLPPSSVLNKRSFVGREKELTDIRQRLADGDRLIILSGLGGIGKTELATRFGRDYEGGSVFFVRFEDSFTRTMAKMAAGIRPKLDQEALSRPEEELCAEVMDILEGCCDTDILIIDNVDADEGSLYDLLNDPAFDELMQLELRLILTTRFDYDRSQISVRALEEPELFHIFDNHGANIPETDRKALIDAVNGHTLTVDQMARLLNGKGVRKVTAEMLLNALKNNTLPRERYREIAMEYNHSKAQARIYENLSIVFNVANIPEEGKSVMRCATLLPADSMDGECFLDALPQEQQDALEALVEHGWLTAEDGLLTIHPVIRLVCREELKPGTENCSAFVNALCGQYREMEYHRVRFAQIADLLCNALEQLEAVVVDWLDLCSAIRCKLGQYQQAMELYNRILPALEDPSIDKPYLALIYNNMGNVCNDLGDHSNAKSCILKAMEILEHLVPEDHPSLATVYSNLGLTCCNLGDHTQALAHMQKALTIRQKVLPENSPDLANSYLNLGAVYTYLGQHHTGLEHLLRALAIQENAVPKCHLDLAPYYLALATSYERLGQLRKAQEFNLKSLAVQEDTLPRDHPHLALTYTNIGKLYNNMGDQSLALEFHLKAVAIQEHNLPQVHPDLAISYANLGSTYLGMGEHKKALEYVRKAQAIWEAVLPEQHETLALCYSNLGMIYGHTGDFHHALQYLMKSLAIREKILTGHHPELAAIYNNLASTYSLMGDHRNSLEYMRKAVAVYENGNWTDHPTLATFYNNIACTCRDLGDFQNALDYMKKALKIREAALPAGHPDTENARRGVKQYQMMLNMQQSGFNFSNPLASKFPRG